jgi:hypothetical protein
MQLCHTVCCGLDLHKKTVAACLRTPGHRTRTRGVDKDSTHGAGRDREKMCAILPGHLLYIDEPQIRFVHQCRGLKGMARALVAHVVVGQAAQLVVEQRRQAVKRGDVPSAPCLQKTGDFL